MRIHQTTDLAETALLYAWGFEIDDIVKDRGGRATFSFKSTDGIHEVVDAFWKEQLLVEPLKFFRAIKHVKTLLYK